VTAAGQDDSSRVNLTLTCETCRTRLQIYDQPGLAALKAYEHFVSEHAHNDREPS
jgi:hypothetical protein